jgi:hypothetical protein
MITDWNKLKKTHIRKEVMTAIIPIEVFEQMMTDGKIYEFDFEKKTYFGKYEKQSSNFFVGKKMTFSDHEKYFYVLDCSNVKEKIS